MLAIFARRFKNEEPFSEKHTGTHLQIPTPVCTHRRAYIQTHAPIHDAGKSYGTHASARNCLWATCGRAGRQAYRQGDTEALALYDHSRSCSLTASCTGRSAQRHKYKCIRACRDTEIEYIHAPRGCMRPCVLACSGAMC